ncbi:hypothetical protein AN664_0229435 [Serratia marcescens]|nr:hypothetical protein AN664_0229435 [Serratia marcescens]
MVILVGLAIDQIAQSGLSSLSVIYYSAQLFSWAVSYQYSLPNYHLLSDYGMEAQASIIADYFYLTKFGRNGFQVITNYSGIIGPDIKKRYEWVLRAFLNNPKNRNTLL